MALRVELDLDDGGFVEGMRVAERSIDSFESKVKSNTGSVKNLEGAHRSLLSTLRDVTVVLGLTHQAMGMIDSVSTSWVRKIVEVNAEFERMITIMRSLSTEQNSVQKAADSVSHLREMAKDAPFALTAIHDAFIRLNAAGLEPMKGSLQGLLDAVSAFGGGDSELGRAALAFQEMAGKGVVQMKELRNQLMMAVPSAARLLARATGESYSEMMADIHTGTVDAKSTIQALELEFERAFGGAAQRQMETFNGQIGRMKVLLQDIAINNVGKPFGADGEPNKNGFFETMKQQMEDFNDLLKGGANGHGVAQGLGNMLGDALTTFVRDMRGALELLVEFRSEIEAAGEALAIGFGVSIVRGIFNSLGSAFESMGARVKAMRTEYATFQATVQANSAARQWANMQGLYAAEATAAESVAKATAIAAASDATAKEAIRLSNLAQDLASRGLMSAEQAIAKAETATAAVAAAAREAETLAAAKSSFSEAAAASSAGAALEGASMLGSGGKNMLAMLPLLAEGLGMVATGALILGPAIAFVVDYFDLFNTKAKDAWQNLERYGAASREAAEGGKAFLQSEQEKLRAMEADRASRLAAEGALGNANAAGAGSDPELEGQRARVASLLKEYQDWQKEGMQNDASRGASSAMKIIEDQLRELQVGYNQASDAAAKVFDGNLKNINSEHKSAALATADYQEQQKNRALGYYDEQIAKIEQAKTAAEDWLKKGDEFNKMVALTFLSQLDEREKAAKAAREQEANQHMGLQLNQKILPDDKLLEKASDEIQKLYAQIDGYKAGIEGSDAAAEQLYQTWLRLGKAGDEHVQAVAEALEKMKALKEEADDYNKIISGGHKLMKDLQDAIDKDRDKIFEDKYGKASDLEKIQAKIAAGEYAGYGGSSAESQRLVAMRERLDETTSAAARAGAALQVALGPTLTESVLNLNQALGGTSNALLSIVNGTTKPGGLFSPQLPVASLNGSIMAGAAPGADWASGINFGKARPNSAQTSPNDPLQDDVKSALHAMQQMFGAFTITSTTEGGHVWDSQHYKDKAVDIATNGMSDQQYRALIADAIVAGFRGIGISDSHLHVDMRDTPGGRPVAFADGGTQSRAGLDIAQWNELIAGIKNAAEALRPNGQATSDASAQKQAELKITEAQLVKANADKAMSDLLDKANEGADIKKLILDGEGTWTAKVTEAIRENGAKSSIGSNDPNDPRWKYLLDAAQKYDAAIKQVADRKSAITDADTSAKSMLQKLTDGRDGLANAFVKLAHGADAASDSLLKVKEEGQRNVDRATKAYGANSPEAATAQQQAAQAYADAQNLDIAKAAEAAQKKTQTLREATMTQEQVEVDKYNRLAQEYQKDLANFTGTEQQKAQLAKIFNDNLAAEWAALQAKTPFAKQMQDWADLTKNLQQATSGFMNTAVDDLTQQLTTGQANWSSFANSILKDLTQIALKASIGGLFNATGMSSLLGGGAGKLGGGGGSKGGPMQLGGGGSKLGGLGALVGIHHTGGMVGAAHAHRFVALGEMLKTFGSAPRFHTGGVIGADEVPIIARKGEGVFTPEQMRNMGGRSGNVTLHNNVTVNANGGTTEQNADLAKQIGDHVERIARSTVVDEIRTQMRPGNMLFAS